MSKRGIDLSDIEPLARRDAAAIRERDERQSRERVDGRTLRRGNRTESIAHRVKPEVRDALINMAKAEGIAIVDVLESSILERQKRMIGDRKSEK